MYGMASRMPRRMRLINGGQRRDVGGDGIPNGIVIWHGQRHRTTKHGHGRGVVVRYFDRSQIPAIQHGPEYSHHLFFGAYVHAARLSLQPAPLRLYGIELRGVLWEVYRDYAVLVVLQMLFHKMGSV